MANQWFINGFLMVNLNIVSNHMIDTGFWFITVINHNDGDACLGMMTYQNH